jgi:DNA-binding transcriptional MerR regulator
MDYKSRHVQKLFNVSAETVRTWADEFEQFLSPLAKPGTGRHRIFNTADLHVFALVAEMKEKGFTYSDIHASLLNDTRGIIPEMAIERAQEVEMAIQLDDAQSRIIALETERDTVLAKFQGLRDENIRLQTRLEVAQTESDKRLTLAQSEAQKRIDALTTDLQKAQSEVNRLSQETGYLRGMSETRQQKAQKEEGE